MNKLMRVITYIKNDHIWYNQYDKYIPKFMEY